jgi:hypothetical protein
LASPRFGSRASSSGSTAGSSRTRRRVTAHCGGSDATVWTSGSILQVQDILGLAQDCRELAAGKASRAELNPLEPGLRILLETDDRVGPIMARVEITPDHLAQEHRFAFEIDPSSLPGLIEACDRILEEYPVRGVRKP